MALVKNLEILQGKTFSQVIRWESDEVVYKSISGITQSAPATVTCVGHGLTTGWRAAVVSVRGMSQINADDPPKDKDLLAVTVVDQNTVQLSVNASDFKAYTSGGYLRFNAAVDLSNCTVRMKVKTKVGGAVLASTELVDAPLNIINVAVNDITKTIEVSFGATDTATLTWKKGVYEIEAEINGVVTQLALGAISVVSEIST